MHPNYDVYYEPTSEDLQDWAMHLEAMEQEGDHTPPKGDG